MDINEDYTEKELANFMQALDNLEKGMSQVLDLMKDIPPYIDKIPIEREMYALIVECVEKIAAAQRGVMKSNYADKILIKALQEELTDTTEALTSLGKEHERYSVALRKISTLPLTAVDPAYREDILEDILEEAFAFNT